MPNQGGRYEIRGGERVLVERTQPAPEKAPKTKAKAIAKADHKPAAKPAPTQPHDVKEQDNG